MFSCKSCRYYAISFFVVNTFSVEISFKTFNKLQKFVFHMTMLGSKLNTGINSRLVIHTYILV